jgi:hypothetical protein
MRKRWGVQAASLFFSAACRKASCRIQISLREDVVGKLPTTAGWQPALPGNQSFAGSLSSSATRFSKRPAPPPSRLR